MDVFIPEESSNSFSLSVRGRHFLQPSLAVPAGQTLEYICLVPRVGVLCETKNSV